MAESFGTVHPPVPSTPIPAGKEGTPEASARRTIPATVVRVLATEGGVVQHEVQLPGRIALLGAQVAIEVGTVLEVLARRDAVGWRAFLPRVASVPKARSAPAAATSPVGGGTPPTTAEADLVGGSSGRVSGARHATSAADRAALQLFRRGLEPTPPLVRGGARIDGAPPFADPVGTATSLATAITRLLAPLSRALPPGDAIRAELTSVRAVLGEPDLPSETLARIPERIVRAIAEAIERVVSSDPRITALRQAISALLSGRSPVDLPASARGLLTGGQVASELPDGLTTAARAKGLETLRAHEVRAIEEHSILAGLRPLLREVVEQGESLAYRLALELADPDRESREATIREWVLGTEEKAARVRWRARSRGEAGRTEETRFRLSTRWPLLGAIEVEGTLRRSPVTSLDLTFAVERSVTRRALRGELPALVESFEGSGTKTSAALRPWRKKTARPASAPRRALDRKA